MDLRFICAFSCDCNITLEGMLWWHNRNLTSLYSLKIVLCKRNIPLFLSKIKNSKWWSILFINKILNYILKVQFPRETGLALKISVIKYEIDLLSMLLFFFIKMYNFNENIIVKKMTSLSKKSIWETNLNSYMAFSDRFLYGFLSNPG